jgi:hypothetical protein
MDTVRQSPPRPDLAAHDRAMRLPFQALVNELVGMLGARLVGYIAGVTETRAVQEWAKGVRDPKDPELERRLRLVLQTAYLVAEHDSREVAQAWFQGLNPQLDDRAPAQLLREGEIAEVGREVLAAARAFVVGG